MTLSQTTEQSQPEPIQNDRAPQLSSEGPKDNKNKIVARLKNISKIVNMVNAEQGKEAKQHPFNTRASELVKLGDEYTQYLESHADEIPDEGTFQAIASLAKSSMLMNIEQYATTIRGIGDFVAAHPELNDLNPPGKTDGPWGNIKEALYYSANNDIREQFRESILTRAQEAIQNGEFSPRDVDHLERFLVDPKGRLPSEFIPEYITTHIGEIKKWSPTTIDIFQEQVIEQVGDNHGDLSQNPYLKQLDEEIASIKPKDLQKASVQFLDRQSKLAFIRDLRFGRVDYEEVKSEAIKRLGEITRRSDLRTTLAPHLKASFPPFLATLKSTTGVPLTERKQILTTLVESYGLEENAMRTVLAYLETNLK